MSLPEVLALTRYWKKWPPVHILVGYYFGLGKEPESTSNEEFLENLGSLISFG